MQIQLNPSRLTLALMLASLTGLIGVLPAEAAPAKLRLTKSQWTASKQTLSIAGKLSNATTGASVELYGLDGRLLGTPTLSNKGVFSLTLNKDQLPEIPCSIRAKSGDIDVFKNVIGAPKSCLKAPQCSITMPLEGAELTVNQATNFKAAVKLSDKKTTITSQEWDFAGGAMQKEAFRKSGAETSATFIRDNSHYRVRYIATDSKGRRCEDAVTVAVGNPPTDLPAKVGEQPASKLGAELDGVKGDLVVLTGPEWSMQHLSDARVNPNLYSSFSPLNNTLNAYVYKKDLKPVLLSTDTISIQYSAASNPSDPVGASSINSTSQNWPLNSTFNEATIRKSDFWEPYSARPENEKGAGYKSFPWMAIARWGSATEPVPEPDQGYLQDKTIDFSPTTPLQPGSEMPGKETPYSINTPKPMEAALGGKTGAAVRTLPIVDVDDKNRINPYPLMRVEAIENGAVKASTDGVLTTGKDFKCRECHAKGGIAANPNAPHTKEAFWSTAWVKWYIGKGKMPAPTEDEKLNKPQFFDSKSNSIEDQEHAAALNYTSLHDFYDNMGLLDSMLLGMARDDNNKTTVDSPVSCEQCHGSAMAFLLRDEAWWQWEQHNYTTPDFDADYSPTIHRFHGMLQYKSANDHSDIKREASGRYERYTGAGLNPLSLFPIFDSNNKQLPMEDNCLKCHAGHREPLYRDRMYTAGVTCYDCHGDMLAVGQNTKKAQNRIGADGNEYRVPWYDEPDCGSCHTGNSKDTEKTNPAYFSAGVMKRAFDNNDLSGVSRKVDLNDSNAARFAVRPLFDLGVTDSATGIKVGMTLYNANTDELEQSERTMKVLAPVYREGKDSHGNVPCAACHGAAHEVWPNRDPNSNDNVTSLQLQGHTGTILECNVCHDKDSFKEKDNIDGGTYSGDDVKYILGGPHNTHPINDPYWWQKSDGGNGGWHNEYAKISGKDGEDQCAACHGADHKGTRLSKTPVERVFINPKVKGIKRKVVVPAGTPIGCDLCHSLEKSKPARSNPPPINNTQSQNSNQASNSGSISESGGMMGSGR